MPTNRRSFFRTAGAALAAGALPAAASAKTPPSAAAPLGKPVIRDGVRIPMRDGAKLAATVFLPDSGKGPWPVIVSLTPYGRTGAQGKPMMFARDGFVFVGVDVRGRGDSDGEFTPWIHEGDDTYDAIEWLATQSYSTGSVGLWGSSYGGFNQWAAATRHPPHLKSIQPAASGFAGFEFPLQRNIMPPYAATWLAYISGKSPHAAFFADTAYQGQIYETLYRSGRPYTDLDEVLGFPSKTFRAWQEHPFFDDFWRKFTPTPEQFAKIDLPIMTVTGHWDSAQEGALEYYRRHAAHAPKAAVDKHYVVIGPFDHNGTRFPAGTVGGIKVPKSGVIDMHALDVAWFDHTLRNGPKPAFLKDRLTYYMLGEDEWRGAPGLDQIRWSESDLWLDTSGAPATDAFHSGALTPAPPSRATTRTYRYDPADFSRIGLGTSPTGEWLTHQTDVVSLNGEGLIYHGEILTKPLPLIDRPTVELFVAIDTPDTDIRARIYEIEASGWSILLGQDRIRMRYRDSLEAVRFATPGATYRLVFDRFPFIARTLPPGSRLRVVIDAPDGAQDQRNFNSGKAVSEETVTDARPVRVTVHHGGKGDSRLRLRVARD